MEGPYVIISIAEVDFPDSDDLRQSSETGGYFFLDKGRFFKRIETKPNTTPNTTPNQTPLPPPPKIPIFGESHHVRYCYKVMRANARMFGAMLYNRALPEKPLVHSSNLSEEILELENKELLDIIEEEFKVQNVHEKKSGRYAG